MKTLAAFVLGGLATYLWLQREHRGDAGPLPVGSAGRTGAGDDGAALEGAAAAGGQALPADSPNAAERLQAQGSGVSPVAAAGMPTDNLLAPQAPAADDERITPGLPDMMRGA